jgi:hypothetical protein
MEVKINKPVYVPPQATYDIIGLTYDEVLVIRHALMSAGVKAYAKAYEPEEALRLHDEITDAV